jgi:hypothetical protein
MLKCILCKNTMKMEISYDKNFRTYRCLNVLCRKLNLHDSLIDTLIRNHLEFCQDKSSFVIWYKLWLNKKIKIFGDFNTEKTYIFSGNEILTSKNKAIYVTDFIPFKKGALKQFNKYISLKEFL